MTEERTGSELAALLAVARATLMDAVVPAVPADRRYPALMIGNALGIAAREVEAGDGPVRAALEQLWALYGGAANDLDVPEAELAGFERRLAAEIRAGVYDSGAGRETVAGYLEARSRAKTAISNPRYLEGA